MKEILLWVLFSISFGIGWDLQGGIAANAIAIICMLPITACTFEGIRKIRKENE